MIGLLIDAAIAVVTVLDRACSAVESVRFRATPPEPVEMHTSPRGRAGSHRPLGDTLTDDLVALAAHLLRQRDEARADFVEACCVGRWLVAESRWEADVLLNRIFHD